MKYLLILLVSITLSSCGNSDQSATEIKTEELKTDSTATSVVSGTTEAHNYELDWRNFKMAVLDKDSPAVGSFIDTDVINSEDLIETFSEYNYRVELEKKEYRMLNDGSWEDKKIKEFMADTEFTDEEGNTYESAIFLYFEEQERGLRLVNFMVAG